MLYLPRQYYGLPLMILLGAVPAQAQSITAADSATTVQQTGDIYQIDGGNLSGDSTTLFHSFEQLGLLTEETAQFSNPTSVGTIVGRVIGGDISVIDGVLAVEGSADLYLINPAGMLFGENAQLNLSGSFSASTATGVTFTTETFETFGNNNFNLFNGSPTGYVFSSKTTGALVNAANLIVNSGQSLTLLAGQVINTGRLSAPNGEILIMAVPEDRVVRLSQTGSLLDLELEFLPNAQLASDFTASTVPALLTGASDLGMATGITVNPDGTVSLSGSSLQIPLDNGTAIVSGQLDANGGSVGILGDQIALVDASVDASADDGGGTVLIGGDQLGAGSVPNAITTVIDETSVIRADAKEEGNGGTIVAWGTHLLSLSGQLSAQGGPNGGDGGLIETSGLNSLDIRTTPDITALNGAGGVWLLDPANIRIVEGNGATNVSPTTPFEVGPLTTDAELGIELIEAALLEGGNVEIRTTGNTPGDGNIILATPLNYDNANDGSLSLFAQGEIQILADITDEQPIGINLFMNPEEDIVSALVPDPDNLNLTLQANDQITINGDISTGDGTITIESVQGDIDITGNLVTSSGDIVLQAAEGSVNISTPVQTGQSRFTEPANSLTPPDIGGDIVIEADGIISANNIVTSANIGSGNIILKSQSSIVVGEIDTRTLNFNETSEFSGDVDLTALENIVFSSIDASSATADAGNVTIESSEGFVRGIGVLPSGSTISTDGGNLDGNITISYGGSAPFVVGAGSLESGTEGDIMTGMITLSEIALEQSFDGGLEIGNITIAVPEEPEEPRGLEEPRDPREPSVGVREILDEVDCDCIRNENTEDIDPTVDITSDSSSTVVTRSSVSSLAQRFSALEERITAEFNDYLQLESAPSSKETIDLAGAQSQLLEVQQQTGKKPALIYAVFGLNGSTDAEGNVLTNAKSSAPLELILITADGEPRFVPLDVTRQEVLTVAQRLRRQVSIPSRANRQDTSYLESAQTLYQWLIAPVQPELEAQNIDTISFVTDAGLRSLPLATLHDGNSFIIQNYNIGLMPSLSLTDLTYQDISNVSALVAGTSDFASQTALPGVPVELDAIASSWASTVLKDNAFNLNQLKGERQQSPYGIIHLATHGEFNVGDLSKSYLYLHNERLSLDQLRTLGLNQPSVELLTLSACQTALGNRSAELGFAGFAVLAGAKTAIASLWSVSDDASAGLMIEFYRQLRQPTIKADALRQAQLAMIQGKVFVTGDQLKGPGGSRQLPPELAIDGQQDFSHPYYWAAFSLVGSPW